MCSKYKLTKHVWNVNDMMTHMRREPGEGAMELCYGGDYCILFKRRVNRDLRRDAVFLWSTLFLTAMSRWLIADCTASKAIVFSPPSMALRAPLKAVRTELIMLWFRLYCFCDCRAAFFAGTSNSNWPSCLCPSL